MCASRNVTQKRNFPCKRHYHILLQWPSKPSPWSLIDNLLVWRAAQRVERLTPHCSFLSVSFVYVNIGNDFLMLYFCLTVIWMLLTWLGCVSVFNFFCAVNEGRAREMESSEIFWGRFERVLRVLDWSAFEYFSCKFFCDFSGVFCKLSYTKK